jgi:hypothetical protein
MEIGKPQREIIALPERPTKPVRREEPVAVPSAPPAPPKTPEKVPAR